MLASKRIDIQKFTPLTMDGRQLLPWDYFRIARNPSRIDAKRGDSRSVMDQVFAGQAVGIKELHDDIWPVSFMDYDLGYFDLETRMLEPLENPFGPKVLPMF